MQVAVIGGRMAGLAAAERFSSVADAVTLFERDGEIGAPVNCGEGITSPHRIPVRKTPENGFVNECPNFVVRVQPAAEFGWSGERLCEVPLACDPAYITDRWAVERAWADRLESRGVDIVTGHAVSKAEFEDLKYAVDVIVDASGNPAVSMKWRGLGDRYGGDMVALNADVEGDFSEFNPEAYVIFEGMKGYFWVFPKSETRANVGIGWTTEFVKEHELAYRDELYAACDRHDVPRPPADDIRVYSIPSGPALHRDYLYQPGDAGEADVYLVGDAAGLANRYQGEGITQAIESSYLLMPLVNARQGHKYPDILWQHMLPEFRLAHLMKSLWDDYRDPQLIADVTVAIEGLTLHQVTREPKTVFRRIAGRPRLAARIASNPRIYKRVYETYAGGWGYAGAT